MSKAYSLDLRHRIIDAVSGGLSCRAAARRAFAWSRAKLAPYREMLLQMFVLSPF